MTNLVESEIKLVILVLILSIINICAYAYAYHLASCKYSSFQGDNVFIGRVVCDERTNIKKHVVSKFLISDQFSTGKNVTAFALEVLSLDISSSGRLLAAGSW